MESLFLNYADILLNALFRWITNHALIRQVLLNCVKPTHETLFAGVPKFSRSPRVFVIQVENTAGIPVAPGYSPNIWYRQCMCLLNAVRHFALRFAIRWLQRNTAAIAVYCNILHTGGGNSLHFENCEMVSQSIVTDAQDLWSITFTFVSNLFQLLAVAGFQILHGPKTLQ